MYVCIYIYIYLCIYIKKNLSMYVYIYICIYMALDSVFSKARFCPLLLHQLLLGRKCLNRTYHGAFVEVPPKSKGHAHPKIAATP